MIFNVISLLFYNNLVEDFYIKGVLIKKLLLSQIYFFIIVS